MVKGTRRRSARQAPSEGREGSGGLPRDEILAHVRAAPGKVTSREIMRSFGIDPSLRGEVKELLKSLWAEGQVEGGRSAHRARGLPPVVVATVTGRTRDGELVAEPDEWEGEGKPPKIVIALAARGGARKGARTRQREPGEGDRVLLRVTADRERGAPLSGRVIKVIGKGGGEILGIYRALPSGGGRIVPVDKKARAREAMVEPGDEGSAADGDLVSARLAPRDRYGLPRAKITERLGSMASERAVSLIAIHAHGIPHVFSKAALAEAEAAVPATMAGREDWRALDLVTIDPPDAKDHDDAVHAAPDEDPKNPGGFVITVAIADVAAYVRPGTALDREAEERGNSVYFPDRVVPMLPERISNDLCSLRPDEDRPALAVRMIISAEGVKKSHSFHRVMIRSRAKLSYEQAQAAIDGRPDETTAPLLGPILTPLWGAYAALARAREARNPLALDLPERKIRLDPEGRVASVTVPPRLEAHRLIEEFMIAANVAAAETLERAGLPLLYRIHDEPSLEKMRALGEVLASIGIKLPKQGALSPVLFNRILAQVRGGEHELFVSEIVLRTQSQAEYAAENIGHFGLNLRRYAHFTSPIRRYADLVVHRGLVTALKAGSDGLPKGTTSASLAELGTELSAAERRAMAAERDTIDRLIAFHLADRVGASFEGRIAGVTRAGLFVKLAETGADGFIPASTVGADYYRHDEKRHALVGDRTGESYRLGDSVEVKLVEAAPVAGALRFELLSKGAYVGRTRGTKGGAKTRTRGEGAARRAGTPPKGGRGSRR